MTLYSSTYFFLALDDPAGLVNLAKRQTPGTNRDFCLEDQVQPDPITGVTVPIDCQNWKPNTTDPPTINVHLVGAFFENEQELDPEMESTGFTPLGSSAEGMILMTDNPRLNARRKIVNYADCSGPRFLVPTSEMNLVYWASLRIAGTAPNLLAHEMFHLLTGYAHTGVDPCNTIAVGQPSTACPRGFSLQVAPFTIAQQCDAVSAGINGRDYTR